MKRQRSILVLAMLGGSAAIVLAVASCVGDDPPGSNAGVDGGRTDNGRTDGGSNLEAGPTCTGSETLCGSSCVELPSSAENCNRCGRSCGGAVCADGKCEVALVRDNIDNLGGFDVDATTLYFTSNDTINRCPLGACTGSFTQVGAMGQYPANELFHDSGFLYSSVHRSRAPSGPQSTAAPSADAPTRHLRSWATV
jgi:hypothetical protein